MLKSLFIKNYVLIKQLELDFSSGFNAFTGETGAGKSIIVGALSLILGNRADYSVIKKPSRKCEISALFDISQNQLVQNWLDEQEIEFSKEIEIRRVITTDGRSKSWLNTRPCTNTSLKKLGSLLVQIYGQHDQIKLNNAKYQLNLIDESGTYQQQLKQIKDLSEHYDAIESQLRQIELAGALNEAESQLLNYQFQELEQLNLTEFELDKLHQQQKELTNAVETISIVSGSLHQLENNPIAEVMASLESIDSQGLSEIKTMLEEVSINLNEIESQLQRKHDEIEVNPEKLNAIENRLEQIYQTARKHNVNAENLYLHFINLGKKLELNSSQKQNRKSLLSQQEKIIKKYSQASLNLHQLRVKSGHSFAQHTTKIIQQLGLSKAQFSVSISHDPVSKISSIGQDRCEFEITMNPGQTPQRMSKTASGGELSRIALAIEICKKQSNSTSFIFDEVDAGIGGAVAETVGKLMRKLSKTQQVFAVTHLPHVAGLAHHHYLVSKSDQDGMTESEVLLLLDMERIEELARMSGGSTITDTTLKQAKSFMLN